MAATNYDRGADFERRVAKDLVTNGYEAFRSAGSHGKADVVAIKPGQILLVQCKRDGEILREEWNDLLELAWRLQPAATMVQRRVVWPLLAYMPGRQGISYKLLTYKLNKGQRRETACQIWGAE